MKKILLSVMTIALVAIVAISATKAYFTSNDTINNMTFATGTLTITDTSETWMQHVSFNNLKPGDTVKKWVTINNSGSLDVASLNVKAVNVNDPNGLLGKITVVGYNQVNGFDQGVFNPGWIPGGNPVNSYLTNGFDLLGHADYRDATTAHVLAPGNTATIQLVFTVPTTLDNTWQGKTASFDLQFTAEQSQTGANLY